MLSFEVMKRGFDHYKSGNRYSFLFSVLLKKSVSFSMSQPQPSGRDTLMKGSNIDKGGLKSNTPLIYDQVKEMTSVIR